MNFFMKVLSYRPIEIATHASTLIVSLGRRVMPRHAVLEILKEKKVVGPNYRLSSCLTMTEPKFFNRFVQPFKGEVLDLYTDYIRKACPTLKIAG